MYLTIDQKELVLKNKGLAYRVAEKFINNSVSKNIPIDDIRQIAMAALCKAALKFNSGKGYKFSSYATRVVTNTLLRELPDYMTMVTYPKNILTSKTARVAQDAIEKFNSGYGFGVPLDEALSKPNINVKDIEQVLDEKIYNPRVIRRFLRNLTPAQQLILKRYYGIDCEQDPHRLVSDLGVPMSCIWSRVYTTKKRFRQLIGEQVDFYI